MNGMRDRRWPKDGRRGAALVMLAVMIVAVLGTVALAVDQGLLRWVRTHLQGTADVAALAAVQELPDLSDVRDTAVAYGSRNSRGWGSVVVPDDVARGRWTLESGFVDGGTPYNAVAVVARRSVANENPVNLLFARVLGVASTDVSAAAVAVNTADEIVGTEFLIDADMFDSDVPAIEELANSLNVDPEEMITARDLCGSWQDWFIQIPPGSVLRLPTGQVGDGGLFDIRSPLFEFTPGGEPYSLEDFLNFNEDSECADRFNALGSDPADALDPLLGPTPIDDEDWYYEEYGEHGTGTARPGTCMVSPVFSTDVGELEPVDDDPAVSALGERRGLVAFRILGAVEGEYLPDLYVEICDPEAILGEDGLGEIGVENHSYRLVR